MGQVSMYRFFLHHAAYLMIIIPSQEIISRMETENMVPNTGLALKKASGKMQNFVIHCRPSWSPTLWVVAQDRVS
jgi:hypothetical protein